MATTDNLSLTLLEVGQLSKEATINEAIQQLDKVVIGEYTVASLPAAGDNANCFALATDASGGRTVVRSDGTNWKVIAVEGATVTT